MPSSLTFDAHLEGLRAALVAFARYADRAGLRAPVPTTPDWTVRRLLAHQGMVHRWAAATVRGGRVDPDTVEREGQAQADPVEWLRDGAVDLALALARAPAELVAPVFLADAPPARRFWARRQCHETTIHAVDALSAVLGRHPRAADTWLADDLALDGIDELLCGFLPRPKSRLRSEEAVRVVVRPEGADRTWVVDVGEGPPVTHVVDGRGDVGGDVLVAGCPVAVYLSLWNRSDEVDVDDLWRERAGVLWG